MKAFLRWLFSYFHKRDFDTTHQGFELVDTRFMDMEEDDDFIRIDGKTLYRSDMVAKCGSDGGALAMPNGVTALIASNRAFFVRYDGVIYVER